MDRLVVRCEEEQDDTLERQREEGSGKPFEEPVPCFMPGAPEDQSDARVCHEDGTREEEVDISRGRHQRDLWRRP